MKYWTCINGHKWKSNKKAKGTFLYGKGQTKCPICKTPICKYVSDDGKQGAIHEGFLKEDKTEKRIQEFVDGYKSGQYDFAQKLKEVLFKDPEPCCHGVREREAFEIIDNLLRDKELNYGDGT